jgi:UDP-3-O-[3-hydroxymyristoyl] glucosamine N-acyltransferase
VASSGLTAQAVADLVGGRLLGNGSVEIRSVAPLDRAGPSDISLVVSMAYRAELQGSHAAAVLVAEEFAAEAAAVCTAIVVKDPGRALSQVVLRLYPVPVPVPGIHATALIGPGAVLGDGVSVGPHVVIGARVTLGARCRLDAGVVLEDDVVLGDDCRLGAHVVIGRRARLGNRVSVKSGAVLGGTGFGFHSGAQGHERIPHVGGLVLGDDVEIGSLTTVDCGSIDDTVIERGTKVDNLVHVGHNVRIGEHCILAGGVMVGGSARLGRFVIVGGSAGIGDHVLIGDGARIGAGTGVFREVPAGATMSGYIGRNHRETLRMQAAQMRLPAIIGDLEKLVEKRRGDA